MRHEKCLRCGRKLRTDSSKELGFGKICWEKYNNEDNYKQLFKMDSELSNKLGEKE